MVPAGAMGPIQVQIDSAGKDFEKVDVASIRKNKQMWLAKGYDDNKWYRATCEG